MEGVATYRSNWAVEGAKVFLADNVTGAVLDSAYTDSTGYYAFAGLVPGDYRVELAATAPPGGIDLVDALLVIHYLAQPPQNPWEPLQLLAADMNADGSVSIQDASSIISYWIWQKIKGWSNNKSGEEEEIEFINTEEDTTSLPPDSTSNDTVTGNYGGTKRGDVDGAFEPQKKPSGQLLVRAEGRIPAAGGEIVRIPVKLNEGMSVSAMGLGFAFNSRALSLVSVTTPVEGAVVEVFENKILIYWVGLNAETRFLPAGELILEIEAMVHPGSRAHDALVYALPGSQWVDENLRLRTEEFIQIPVLDVKPESAILSSNYPNPAKDYTTFELELHQQSALVYEVFQMNGSKVFSSAAHTMEPGIHPVTIPLSSLPAGAYMVVFELSGPKQSRQTLTRNIIKE